MFSGYGLVTLGIMLIFGYLLYSLHDVTYLGGFSAHGFFANGFLFPVKELGFLTNLGHWVRVLDVVGSDMYIVL